jgi:hypothetical protein
MDRTCTTHANMRNTFKIVILKAKGRCNVGGLDIGGRIILIWNLVPLI